MRKTLTTVCQQLRQALPGDGGGLSDGQLLERFRHGREEAAFAALVQRHGPMVLGVCRRVTGHAHDADDAFQATFLVLVRRAADVRRPERLANWLFGVAHRTALKARARAFRRQARERTGADLPDPPAPIAERQPDLWAVLDGEVRRLPDAFRGPVVLCDLEGHSRPDAAKLLGCPAGTLSSRLARGRELLRQRLTRRGLALATAGLAVAVPRELTAATLRNALAGTTGPAATVAVPAAVAHIARGVQRAMMLETMRRRLGWGLGLVLLVGLGAWLLAPVGQAATPPPLPQAVKAQKPAEPKPAGPGKLYFFRQGRICAMPPDGKGEEYLNLTVQNHPPHHFRISPDGRWSAYGFQVENHQGPGDIPERVHVRGFGTKAPERYLGVDGIQWCWSPDSKTLLVVSFDPNTGPAHTLVDIAEGTKTPLKLSPGHIVTDWFPDGKTLLTTVFVDGPQPKAQLYRVGRDGGNPQPITDGSQNAFMGQVSPDGQQILFISQERPQAETNFLCVVGAAGGKVMRVTQELNASIQGYCWSPDGKRIAFAWRQVHQVPAGGKPQDLGDKETESFLILADPDGKNPVTLLTEKGKGQWHITLMDVSWR